jgi:hypothetical protein
MERFTPQTIVMFLQVFEISGGGGDIYHSFGDDESVPEEERELGIFAMPFVGCDTVIMSRPGEEPPLEGPLWYIGDRCWHRTDGIRKMQADINAHVFNTETVYTFCLWGAHRAVFPSSN